jgi:RNA polymerase-binding transcription factor DksA
MTESLVESGTEAHHLTRAGLDVARAALDKELDEHRRTVKDLQDAVDDLGGHRERDTTVRELAAHALARALDAMAEIEAALYRLDQGTYGNCERCGVLISSARLEAIPYTRHCVNCHSAPARLAG